MNVKSKIKSKMERFKNFYVVPNTDKLDSDCELCEGDNIDGTCIASHIGCPLKMGYYFKKREL